MDKKTPTAKEIIAEFLRANGFDGLYAENCGCTVDDLAPCFESGDFDCRAGYKIPCDPETCPADGDCEFHIGPNPQEIR